VDRTELAAAWDEGARVALVPGSLLDAAALGELAVSLPPDRGGLIITDPFADGLFDGQFLNSGGSSPIAPGLSDGESLRQRFAPVLRFGFLPVARRRTLAQASLLYLLSIPRVVSVIVPLDSPEGLAQGLALPEVPRLTAEEREKVRVLSRELV
jgi:aryl-alcohol dehydrogenase-like predicted oxidoreductase